MQKNQDKSRKNTKKPEISQERMDFLTKNEPPTRTDFLEKVSKELASIRRALDITQEKLNDRLGIADRLVNKWECGDKTPSGFNLYCWADALGERLSTVPKDTVYAEFTLSCGEVIKRKLENAE